jgi:integrase
VNYARVDARELPALLRNIEVYQGIHGTRLAIKLMSLPFVRTSELIGARWTEFELEAGRGDIPPEQMKMRTPHIVPIVTPVPPRIRHIHRAEESISASVGRRRASFMQHSDCTLRQETVL